MDLATILYLGVTTSMLVIFVAIIARTYNSKRKDSMEAPKYRMLEDDD